MDDFGRLQDEVALELLRGSHGQHRLLHQGGHGRHRHHRPVVEHEPVLRAEGAAAAPVDCESIPPAHTFYIAFPSTLLWTTTFTTIHGKSFNAIYFQVIEILKFASMSQLISILF